jgi:hypothetical protein
MVFSKKHTLLQRSLEECPQETLPARLRPYLLESDNRVYCQSRPVGAGVVIEHESERNRRLCQDQQVSQP